MHLFFRGSALALLTVLATAPVRAEDAPSVTTLPEVTVVGDRSPSLTVPDAAEARQQLGLTPGGVDFIDASDYETGRASNIRDALDFQPGVFVQSRFGNDEARISIRGSGIQRTFHGRGLLVLQDGAPVNMADGMFDMQSLEPLSAQYIEVWRGADALQYGASTLGGAVNFVSHTGHDADPVQTRFEAGSYGYLRGQASSGLVEGKADYYASVTDDHTDGYRDLSAQNAERVMANVGYRFTDDVESRVFFSYANSRMQLPGSLTKAQAIQDPTLANPANAAIVQSRNYDLWRLSDITTVKVDPDAVLTVDSFWWRKDLDHPIQPYLRQLTNTGGAFTQYRNTNDLLGQKNLLTAGFNPMWTATSERDYLNAGNAEGLPVAKRDTFATNLALYAEDQHYLLPQLALVAGMQASYVDLNSSRYFPNDRNGDNDYYGVSPKLGLRYEFTPKIQAYANVSRSFEPPGFTDLDTGSDFVATPPGALPPGGSAPTVLPASAGELKPLRAQTATTAEVGTRGEWDRFSWDLGYYYSWVDNELLSTTAPDGVTNLGTVNATPTIHQGVEAGFDARLLGNLLTAEADAGKADQLVLRTVYDWNDFRFASSPSYRDNRLPGIPQHYFREELMYEHPCGFYIGPNVEWASKTAVDMNNTAFAPSYAVLGAKIGYKSKKGFSVFLEGRNLADKNYIVSTGVTNSTVTASTAQYIPGEAISFTGGIEFRY